VSIYSRAGQVKYETSSLAKLPGEYHYMSIYSRAGQVKYETSSLAHTVGENHCKYVFSGKRNLICNIVT